MSQSNAWVVWNEARNEGFVTTDQPLAHAVCNFPAIHCRDSEGNFSELGAKFSEQYGNDNCTIEEVVRVPVN